MPSPFPGMDPFLEDPGLWPDVHHELISAARQILNRKIAPRYVARIEDRVYLADEDDPNNPFRIPDLRVTEKPPPFAATPAGAEVLTITKPITTTTMPDVEVHEARIEIIDREGREVVTVIEILSPTNKSTGSNGRESFLKKKDAVLHSPCHWVEIDFLRAGLPTVSRQGTLCDYLVHLSRADQRPKGDLWPIRLREQLPVIAIPLCHGDPDVALDLQRVFESAYDRPPYEMIVDYRRDPIPPLSAEYAAWADALLREKGLRK